MDTRDTHRLISRATSLDGLLAARWARAGLLLSVVLMALAPLAVADTYSVLFNTLSESGGQGVQGAWVFRSAVVVTAVSVLLLISASQPVWDIWARRWIGIYTLALVMLVAFPESSWELGANDETVAFAHTTAGVVGAVAFVIAALIVSVSRVRRRDLILDWLVIAALALIPQIMLLSPYPGLWQRAMVGLGYVWLIVESGRIATHHIENNA